MLRSRASQAVLVLTAALLPATVRADVIYTNFGDGDSFLAGSGLIVTSDGAAWSSVAVSFVPAAAYSLSSIEFAASTLVRGAAGPSLAVFADDDGHPAGTPLETLASDGLLASFGESSSFLTVRSAVHPFLRAGETYWIGMNAAAGGLAVWNQTASLTVGFAATDGAGHWSPSDGVQGAVQVDGTLVLETPLPVPEPGPLPDPIPAPVQDDPAPILLVAAEQQEIPPVVPEPGGFGIMGFGLAAALLLARRQHFAGFPHQK